MFSQFTSHLKLVRNALHAQNIKTHYLDGETLNRADVIQQFREDPDPCAFMISLKTGGLGLNLVEANTVFLLDPWWNPSAENQAIDRAHRIGQENPVTVYRFLMKDSIEEKVFALQKNKKVIEKSLISEEALDRVALDEETLERLLE
jgi:SNF2 family DNA or RNA helicase